MVLWTFEAEMKDWMVVRRAEEEEQMESEMERKEGW